MPTSKTHLREKSRLFGRTAEPADLYILEFARNHAEQFVLLARSPQDRSAKVHGYCRKARPGR